MSKAPSPPNPYTVSAAQTQSNQQTAAYNAALNRVSAYTPYGDLVYSQSGTDASGAPQYRADVSLTPASQQQLETQQAQDSAIAGLGLGLTDQIGHGINTPLPDAAQSNDAARQAYYGKETAFLDPQYANLQSDLNSSLAGKGVIEGSDAWQRAQDELGRQRTMAYGQAADSAIGAGQAAQAQALANAITLKNQPINQLSAIRSGTQIQNPNFPSVPQANANPTDVSGNVWNSYNAQVANSNNMMNGLFGLGSAAIQAAPTLLPLLGVSDRRLKTAIRRVGETPLLKLPLYAFRYLWGGPVRVGVMADEARAVRPEAVVTLPCGYMAVDYGMLA